MAAEAGGAMSEQGTTKDLSTDQENELICEKLLGWKRATSMLVAKPDFIWMDGHVRRKTPRFTAWADAGLILEALAARKAYPVVGRCATVWTCTAHTKPRMDEATGCDESGPLAIRAAALEYIRSLR
jgi:hypothetical protein